MIISYPIYMKKQFFCTLMMALIALSAFAVPAKPGITKKLTLTDNTTVTATLVGDEHGHYWLASNGKAYLDVDGTEIFQQVNRQEVVKKAQARRSQVNSRRMRRLAPKRVGEIGGIIGEKKGLIILVNFSNASFQEANDNALYQRIANEVGLSEGDFKGSMYDYFYAQSDGQFKLNFDVVGPVTVSKARSYYGENDSEGNDKHPAEMVIEALKLADSQVDYANYDWNDDGEVEQVYVVYAGKGEADGGASSTIWPHEWTLNEAKYYNDGSGAQTLDGVKINTYACGGELSGSGEIAGIGTMCHEFSHCLGYPDFYDTDYSGGQGMGYWDLMDSGSYNGNGHQPAGYTSYERWVAGWKTPIELTTTQTISNMKALTAEGESYVIYNPGNRDEYLLLENRQKMGWDAALPGEGLLILHVDYDASIWASNTPNDVPSHQRMTWIAADNNYQYTMYNDTKYYTTAGMATDPYPYGAVNSFGKNTTPAAKLYNANTDGTNYLNASVEDITQNADGTISFNFKGEEASNTEEEDQETKESFDFSQKGYANAQKIENVTGTNCSITFDKGTNSNTPTYYTEGTAIRLYGSNSMTVASSKTIVKIELNFGSGDKTNNSITTNIGTYNDDGTWTGSASSVTFTISGTSGHRRIKQVKVTYVDNGTGGGGDEPSALTYYLAADGKKGAELKTALSGIIYNRTELQYDNLWSAFMTTDIRSDGKIWDMYSNITNYDPVTSGSNYSKEGDCYNREHSFPQSWFGSNTPMYTDLHHIYPTDGFVNGKRANYPLGETAGDSYKSTNDFSKLGSCTDPGYKGTVFEPADEYKGDFARTYFYMVICYEEKLHDWYTNYTESRPTLDGNTYPGLSEWQLKMLIKWAKNDPVSDKETARNEAVYALQKNRNPFIDYPGLEVYIWGKKADEAFSCNNYVCPTDEDYDNEETIVSNGYELVTDASTLAEGDKILIASDVDNDKSMVLGTTQNDNNRAAVSITKNSDGTLTPDNNAQVITLEKNGDNFLFNVGNGYLYAASSSKNYLRTEETADDNAKASISINSGTATITFQGAYTRNIIRYNPNNGTPIFSCYSSATGNLPQIYRQKQSSERVTITLADASEQNSAIIANNDQQLCNVTLSDRTLYRDGEWNTICLPFIVSDSNPDDNISFTGTPIEGAVAKTLSDATMDGTTVSLTFADVNELQAGVPYIIKWNESNEEIVAPTFMNVTLVNTALADRTISMAEGNVKFIGYYDAFNITPANDDIYYLTAGNLLKHTAKARTLKACRAYFQFPSSITQNVKDFVLHFDGEESIDGIKPTIASEESGVIYDLSGRKVKREPLAPGIYIVNGHKVAIR